MSGETQSIEVIETATLPVFEDRKARARPCQLRLEKNEYDKWIVVAFVGGWFPASPYEVALWEMLVDARQEIKALKAQNKTLVKMLGSK